MWAETPQSRPHLARCPQGRQQERAGGHRHLTSPRDPGVLMAWQQAPESSRPRTCGSRSLRLWCHCCRSHSNLAVTNDQLADSRGGAPTSPVSGGSADVAIRARGSGDCVTSLFENTICYFHSSSKRLKPTETLVFSQSAHFTRGKLCPSVSRRELSSRAGLPRTSEQECLCGPGPSVQAVTSRCQGGPRS